jgi:hypothetical protein
LATALWRFWLVHGHPREGRRWLAAVLVGSRGALPAVRAKALYGAVALGEDQGDYAAARAFLEASLALRRESVPRLAYILHPLYGGIGWQGNVQPMQRISAQKHWRSSLQEADLRHLIQR